MFASAIAVVLLWLVLRKFRMNWMIGMAVVGLFVAYISTIMTVGVAWTIETEQGWTLEVYGSSAFPLTIQHVHDYAMDTASTRIVFGWPDGPTVMQFDTLQGGDLDHYFKYQHYEALAIVGFASLAAAWATVFVLRLLEELFPIRDPRIGRREDLLLLVPLFLIVAFQGIMTLGGSSRTYFVVAGGVLIVMAILVMVDWFLKGRHKVPERPVSRSSDPTVS